MATPPATVHCIQAIYIDDANASWTIGANSTPITSVVDHAARKRQRPAGHLTTYNFWPEDVTATALRPMRTLDWCESRTRASACPVICTVAASCRLEGEELADVCGRIASTPLDRSKPVWETQCPRFQACPASAQPRLRDCAGLGDWRAGSCAPTIQRTGSHARRPRGIAKNRISVANPRTSQSNCSSSFMVTTTHLRAPCRAYTE
jgi:hypothetical protein